MQLSIPMNYMHPAPLQQMTIIALLVLCVVLFIPHAATPQIT